MRTTIDYILLEPEWLTSQPRAAVAYYSADEKYLNVLADDDLASRLDQGLLLYRSEGENLMIPEKGDILSYQGSNAMINKYEIVIREIREPQIPNLTVRVGVVELGRL